MRRVAIALMILLIIAACTSRPYLKKTTIDEANNKRTEVICTHKKAIIPWYAGIAAGFFAFNYGQECVEKVSALSEPPFTPPVIELPPPVVTPPTIDKIDR